MIYTPLSPIIIMKTDSLRQSSRLRMAPQEEPDPPSSVNPSDVSLSNGIDHFFRKKEEELGRKESRFGKVLDSKEFQSLAGEANNSRSISKFSRFSKSSLRKEEDQLRGVIE